MSFIIEISGEECTACTMDGQSLVGSEFEQDLIDCTGPGDAERACAYVLDQLKPEFRIVAKNAAGDYENRLATDDEMADCARAIYFESDTDFSDRYNAATYLIWQIAHDVEYEMTMGEG